MSAKAAQTPEPATDTAGNDGIARRLRSLKKLLDEGLITREEYEQLRRKILHEL